MTHTKWCVLAIVAVATICVHGTATAAIIASNDASLPGSPDGNNITSDDLTGLDWLDPTATLNYSFNEITARFSDDLVGFRYASRDEIVLFLSHVSPSLPTNTLFGNADAYGDAAPYDTAASYLGDTYEIDGERGIFGITGDISGVDSHFAYQLYRGPDNNQYYGTFGSYSIGDDTTTLFDTPTGSWLTRVTPTVPEPSSIILWVAGMAGLAGAHWRQRRKRQSRGD